MNKFKSKYKTSHSNASENIVCKKAAILFRWGGGGGGGGDELKSVKQNCSFLSFQTKWQDWSSVYINRVYVASSQRAEVVQCFDDFLDFNLNQQSNVPYIGKWNDILSELSTLLWKIKAATAPKYIFSLLFSPIMQSGWQPNKTSMAGNIKPLRGCGDNAGCTYIIDLLWEAYKIPWWSGKVHAISLLTYGILLSSMLLDTGQQR